MTSTREKYLTSEVMTSPPQKLQLMVIEAALRSAHRARDFWQAHDDEQALDALIHAQECVNELLTGLNRESGLEVVDRIAAIYVFIFRSLVEAAHQHDETKLADAVRILEIERETWRQVCEKLATSHVPATPAPLPPVFDAFDSKSASGLSLEA